MAVLEIQLPEDIEQGAGASTEFNTSVYRTRSGFVKKNRNWDYPLIKYDAAYGMMRKRDPVDLANSFNRLYEFFMIVGGQDNEFLFKDWNDFQIGRPDLGIVVANAQEIAQGDDATTEFQIVRRYEFSPAPPFDRPVYRIVAGTDHVWLDAVELTRVVGIPATGEYSIDITTGMITLGDVATMGQSILVIAEFRLIVQFTTDVWTINIKHVDAGNIPSVEIEEVRQQ